MAQKYFRWSFRMLSLGLVMGLGLSACQSEPPADSASLAQHGENASALTLEREASGPYVTGVVENFRAGWPAADITSVRWSASGGKLETSGERVAWTLPSAGVASLTATVVTTDGAEVKGTWNFQVTLPALAENAPLAPAPAAAAATAVAVDTSGDTIDPYCELAFDTAGTGYLAYYNSKHDSLWLSTWNGTTWTPQLVDGPGFGTGRRVQLWGFALAVAGDGTPHLVYQAVDSAAGTTKSFYATRVNGNWVREVIPVSSTFSNWMVALDPTNANRPTVVGDISTPVTGQTYSSAHRLFTATRTAANTWTVNQIDLAPSSGGEELAGEALFDDGGTLYIPWLRKVNPDQTYTDTKVGLVTVKGTTVRTLDFSAKTPAITRFSTKDIRVSLAWAGTKRLLIRSGYSVIDVAIGISLSGSTWQEWDFEDSSSTNFPHGDLVWADGKPFIAYAHGTSVELITPDANNYWTYTAIGTSSYTSLLSTQVVNRPPVSLAVRPTTGQRHVCYPNNDNIMFQ
ncbi:hypothetical protein JGU66_32460 [Myxococcaceae bacterium JPH2]|nr:hypothetical protein [Myxococcaceae bacterium JPH2]